MKWDFSRNPGYGRVIAIGILIFLEALLVPLYGQLTQGTWPTPIQIATFLVAASLTLVTYWLGFLRKEEEAE